MGKLFNFCQKGLEFEFKRKSKNTPCYNIKLKEFKAKEKEFLNKLKEEEKELKLTNGTGIKRVDELERRGFKAYKKREFYKGFVDLTYDAELIYLQSNIEIAQIPQVLEFSKKSYEELVSAREELSKITEKEEKDFSIYYENFKKEEKEKLKRDKEEIKRKQRDGLISEKAKDEGIKALKRKMKDRILMEAFKSNKNNLNEIIKNKKHELNKTLKQKIHTININVDDVRRTVPVEITKKVPYASYLTFLIPGLGQLLNKQYLKSIIMFLGTIYIYLIAIPYALGFGNYRGKGISGLISLANGAGKLDRSIIFMVEGVLAIVLLVIAIVIMLLSFKDANKVEKEMIRGIRERSFCETKQNLFEDGFPYLVSTPALVIIIFIVLIPIITTILLSFTGMDPEHQAKFSWDFLSNYKMIALGEGMAGSIFWKILGWTVIWTIGATTLSIFLGFALALLLNNERIKGKTFFRSVYLLPWAVPAFITILFFSILSAPDGALTNLLRGIFGPELQIKNDPFVSKVVLISIQGWLGSAYIFLLATGVLQSINKELYEAADIDGASSFRKLTKITIPLVLFQTAPLLVGQYTFNFNNFANIYLFNSGGPFNPVVYGNLAGETDILISYIFKLTMENQYQALGAAITILISLALMVIAFIGYRNTDAFRKEKK
ncbi:MAG: carbohydrate ABC transporter permease [Clostridium sp.]